MEKQSRRQFITAGAFLAAAGLGSALIAPLVGGKRSRLAFAALLGAETADSAGAAIDPSFVPVYLKLHETGELAARGERLWRIMENCELCPRMCRV
ncbi:MAG TPA: hypothetical protein VMX58_07185, partial [Patescibacteria group bacterium]|nr:hypothetical protein [Patescibacteria group bacterium]